MTVARSRRGARRAAPTEPRERSPARRTAPEAIVLVDTNVLVDFVLGREPWGEDAKRLVAAVDRGTVRGYIAGHAVTTLYCLVERATNHRAALVAVSQLLGIFEVVALTHADFHQAVALDRSDFEDAVQAVACLRSGARYLVTRNGPDFKGAPVRTCTPREFVAMLAATASRVERRALP